MANRPVFVPAPGDVPPVQTRNVDFEWHPGLALSQKRKSIASLHDAARKAPDIERVLEVSTRSPDDLGRALSAFNLSLHTPAFDGPLSVECAFQGSKVFERGGPFVDLFMGTSRDAKGDDRLRTSGQLIGFRFMERDWGLEPQTAFYDWLYIGALKSRNDLVAQLSSFSAFTDIEFNPAKSFSCQAFSVALFSSLQRSGLLDKVMSSEAAFLDFLHSDSGGNRPKEDQAQGRLL